MSVRITQPVNQVRLTNVAIIRLNKNGKRFEAACYCNKILNYRQGVETDLSEVLQTDRVFSNVSKGRFAKSLDLRDAFGTDDQEKCCRYILDEGQVQMGDRERSAAQESASREIATMVASKCVHTVSERPFTVNQVREAMNKAGVSVKIEGFDGKGGPQLKKRQFLDCVRTLRESGILPIRRANMELAVVVDSDNKRVSAGLKNDATTFETSRNILKNLQSQLVTDGCVDHNTLSVVTTDGDEGLNDNDTNNSGGRIIFMIDPSMYRAIEAIAINGGGRLEVIRHAVIEEGDAEVGAEVERKELKVTKDTIDSNSSIDNKKSDVLLLGKAVASASLDDSVLEDASNNISSTMNHRSTTDDIIDKNSEYDYKYGHNLTANSRKQKKKSQKKNKKTKRRELDKVSEKNEVIDTIKGISRSKENQLEFDEACKKDTDQNAVGDLGKTTTKSESNDIDSVNRKSCNTCGGSFEPSKYRAHFQSDWHRYNQKLKMKGITPIDESEFLTVDDAAFLS